MKPARATLLPELLNNPLLWRGDSLARADASLSTGFSQLDRELPGGGWPKSAVTELLHDCTGVGEIRLLLPALRHLAKQGEWIALVAPPHVPYAPAFASYGIDPARVIVIRCTEEKSAWWAAEQVLRANSAGALLFWPRTIQDQGMRRLQLAAQEGEALAFFFTGMQRIGQPSPSPLRIRLSPAGAELCIDVFKRRGGVMTRPLRLDVSVLQAAQTTTALAGPVAVHSNRLAPKRPRSAVNRAASFTRHYPVGGPQAHIWNRALAHADEGRKSPRPDPREGEDESHHRETTRGMVVEATGA